MAKSKVRKLTDDIKRIMTAREAVLSSTKSGASLNNVVFDQMGTRLLNSAANLVAVLGSLTLQAENAKSGALPEGALAVLYPVVAEE